MTPEERFELNKGWAEGQARKRHSKLKAVLAAFQVPTIEELTNAALEGLWKACMTYYRECSNFRYFARSKINAEFSTLRREYQKYVSQGRDNVHGSSGEVESVLASGRVRQVRERIREAPKRGTDGHGSQGGDDSEVRSSNGEALVNAVLAACGYKGQARTKS